MKKVINIFGDISSDTYWDDVVSAKMISDELKDLKATDELEFNINSFGGEVFEAVAISNLIASSPASKVFNVIGICASAATMLFSATDTVNISTGAMVMYHKPMAGTWGNASEMRKTAALLDKIENENIVKNLAVRTKKPVDELAALIAGEWWLTSDEAVENLGFLATKSKAVENKAAKTKQENIYKNYIERKKALSNDAYFRFINFKNSLR
jgi:ATP-dependent Clp protease, protease subunit